MLDNNLSRIQWVNLFLHVGSFEASSIFLVTL